MAPLLKLAPFMMRVEAPLDKVMFTGAMEVTDGLAPVWALTGPERDRKRTAPVKPTTVRTKAFVFDMWILYNTAMGR